MKSSGFNGILNPVWNATLIDQWCSVCLKRQWHVLYSLLLTASFGFHKGAKLLEEYHLPLHYKIMGLKWRKRFYSRGPRGFSPCQSTSTSILLQAQSSGVVFGVIDSRSSLTESQWELEIMHFDIYHRFQLRKQNSPILNIFHMSKKVLRKRGIFQILKLRTSPWKGSVSGPSLAQS